MKKFLLATVIITLLLACNVIYAKQTNHVQDICNIENCPTQTCPYLHNNNNENYSCYVEGCTQNQQHTHNNCLTRNNYEHETEQNNTHHNRHMRHH